MKGMIGRERGKGREEGEGGSQSPEVEQYWCWIGDYTWSLRAMNIGGPAALVFEPGQWPKKCSLEIV